jgi:YD repeat-containing protein
MDSKASIPAHTHRATKLEGPAPPRPVSRSRSEPPDCLRCRDPAQRLRTREALGLRQLAGAVEEPHSARRPATPLPPSTNDRIFGDSRAFVAAPGPHRSPDCNPGCALRETRGAGRRGSRPSLGENGRLWSDSSAAPCFWRAGFHPGPTVTIRLEGPVPPGPRDAVEGVPPRLDGVGSRPSHWRNERPAFNPVGRHSVGPTGSTLSSFRYSYNEANQRVRVDLADGSFWIYEYNLLGQVRSGRRYWADGSPVAGQQFEYGFDDIGNRKVARRGGDENGWNLRESLYGVNVLNQYTNRTVLGFADVVGVALATKPVYGNGQMASRKGEYFRRELSVNNAGGPVWLGVTVTSPGEPTVTGNLFVPRTPEVFTHDLDGNLTSDGRWTYTWDAENRLLRVQSRSDTPQASWRRVE